MRKFVRFLALILGVVLLLNGTVFAAGGTSSKAGQKPVSQMTDEELAIRYRIPDTWARKDLIFAVRNGLMEAKIDRGICPKDKVTRAEMAEILTKLLRTTTEADLSAYSDVDSSAWYYSDLARVKALGVLAGNGKTKLRPEEPITRQEAFATMARVFGIYGTSKQGVYGFDDWKSVSDWAVPELSALVRRDYIRGVGNLLKPTSSITREELAYLIHSFVDHVTTALDRKTVTGNYALNADTVPAGTTVKGDLLLTNEAGKMTLDHVTVKGRLILQGNSKVVLTLKDCSIQELVTCRSTVIHAESGDQIRKLGVHALTRLYGHVPVVNVYGSFVLREGSQAEQLTVYAKSSYVTVDGKAETVNVWQENCKLNGSGRIGTLNVRAAGLELSCQVKEQKENILPGISGMTATRTAKWAASTENPKKKLGLKLTNLPSGKNDCTVIWRLDGKKVHSERRLLQEGDRIYYTADFTEALQAKTEQVKVTVEIKSNGGVYTYSHQVPLDYAREEALSIRTQAIQAKITYTTGVYKNFNVYTCEFSTYKKNVAANTQVTILKTSHSTGAKIRMPDGSVGWVSYSAIKIINDDYYTTKDYSKEAKEYFVNKIKSVSSTSKYMIWISLYTQRVNIFKGSKGSWELVRTAQCSSGRNYCPTPVGTLTVTGKESRWYFTNYYVHHITKFDESRAFHSRPTAPDGSIYDETIGVPASNGCVRMLDKDCIWIYNNIPVGTTVYIY